MKLVQSTNRNDDAKCPVCFFRRAFFFSSSFKASPPVLLPFYFKSPKKTAPEKSVLRKRQLELDSLFNRDLRLVHISRMIYWLQEYDDATREFVLLTIDVFLPVETARGVRGVKIVKKRD